MTHFRDTFPRYIPVNEEARLGARAGALADARVDGQLVVVRVGRHVVFQRSCSPLSTQPINHTPVNSRTNYSFRVRSIQCYCFDAGGWTTESLSRTSGLQNCCSNSLASFCLGMPVWSSLDWAEMAIRYKRGGAGTWPLIL